MFEWDEDKRIKNILKHGLDFLEAPFLFDNPRKLTFEFFVRNEERFLDMAVNKETLCCLVYTKRGENIRLISFRKASRKEKRRYENNKND
jgi:uncharacterized DUF497 family protein